MNDETTFILGAGFSCCSKLPLQKDFSSLLFSKEFNTDLDCVITSALEHFLNDVFGWKKGNEIPSLEDIFTCIDLSLASEHHLGIKYTPKMLRALQRMAIYRIFSVLNYRFSYSTDIKKLLEYFLNKGKCNFVVLNWDIVLEKHLTQIGNFFINYGCPCQDWNDMNLIGEEKEISVSKMHGSSNWVYCDNCKTLFYDLYDKLALHIKAGLVKSDFRLFDESFTDKKFDDSVSIQPFSRSCKICRNLLSSHIATFSYRKSFRTTAYPSIWYNAEKTLANSNHWIFVGYSLPEADYELKHLLKSAQIRLKHIKDLKKEIEVIAKNDLNTKNKFGKFFGDNNITFFNDGLSGYIQDKV